MLTKQPKTSDRHTEVQISRAIRDLDTAEDAIKEDIANCGLVLSDEALARVTRQMKAAQRAIRQARARLRSI